MNNKKLQEGLEALNRIKLLMEYDMSKTLTENIYEQDDEQKDAEDLKKGGKVEVDDYDKKEGYFTILTPDNKGIYVPNGTKILKTATEKDWDLDSWSSVKWFKSRKETAMWLPRDFSNIIKVGSVLRFQTPDNIIYKSAFDNKSLPDNVTWSEFYAVDAKPNNWYFKGYVGSNNKYYESSSPNHSTLESVGNWFKNNWEELAWIAAAVIASVLTGGIADAVIGTTVVGVEGAVGVTTAASLIPSLESMGIRVTYKALASYLGEAAVWSTKAGFEFAEGKNESAVIDLLFGFVLPVLHGYWASKLGFGNITESQVKNLAVKVMGKTPLEMEQLWKLSVEQGGLTKLEKRIFKRAVTIPKETWSEVLKTVMAQAGKNLEEKGINPVTKMQELLWKSSNYVNKTWYKRLVLKLPVILAHDLTVIGLIESILKKFGIEDEPEKLNVEDLVKIIEYSKKNGTKDKVISDIKKSLDSSKTNEEFKVTIKKLKKQIIPQVTIDTGELKMSDTLGRHSSYEDLMKQYGE